MSHLIDTHFHLDYYRDHRQIYDSINNLKQYTLCMTNSPGVFISCKSLYPATRYVKFALGFHPQEKSLTDTDFLNFLSLFNRSDYIGEVGLDFSEPTAMTRSDQIKRFQVIVQKCSEQNKLLSVHLRKSEDFAIEIIKKYYPNKCIIHWFNGTKSQMNELLNLNCYFSINANMVKTTSGCEKLKLIPSDKILVESDGPFSKVNNSKFDPALLRNAYELISEKLDNTQLIPIVHSNFRDILSK